MIHILVLTTNNNEKNAYVKRIQSALNTLCSVTPGLTSNIRVKDIVIQVTYVNPKTGNAVGAFHIQPDYYIDNSGECSSMLNDLCRGAEKLKTLKDVISIVKHRDHFTMHESYNRI